MDHSEIPLRSALFVPAANARALEKSLTLGADALIFDLEDSALASQKDGARERLRDHLSVRRRASAQGPLLAVRINPLRCEWGTEDLLMARGAGVDAILLPKVEAPGDVAEVAAALRETDAPENLKIWAMIETAKGLLDVARIAQGGQAARLGALVVGPNDIVLSTGVRLSAGREQILGWLSQVVLAAKAHGLRALDGIYNDLADTEGFAGEAAAGRALGFDGKTLIHPDQIGPANRAFGPSETEIEAARRIVAAFADPANRERGVIALSGRMVERLHLLDAEKLLRLQAAIETTHGSRRR